MGVFPDKSGIVPDSKRKLVKCSLICFVLLVCYCNGQGFYVPLEIFVPFLSLFLVMV